MDGDSTANDPMARWLALMRARAAEQEAALGQTWIDFVKEHLGAVDERPKPIDEMTECVNETPA